MQRLMIQPGIGLTRKTGTLLVLLLALGFLGNFYAISLHFGADFVLGSIAVLLVLYYFGLGWGLLAALLANGYTYFLWGHPYAGLTFMFEALFVGLELRSGRRNLLLLDGLFWLLIGMPLAWFFMGVALQMDAISATFIMLKQGINGIFNAFLASLAISYLPLHKLFDRPQAQPTRRFHDTLFNLMVALVLCPAIILMVLEIKQETAEKEATTIEELAAISSQTQAQLRSWHERHLHAISELASLAGRSSLTPSAQLQHETEILKKSFPDFRTMHVENAQGITIVYSPTVNARGESTIGLDFSSRPWFQEIKATRRPVVSEVFWGNKVIFEPIISISTPVLQEDKFLGCAAGVLDLRSIQELFRTRSNKTITMILIDADGQVIASSSPQWSPMQPWERDKSLISLPLKDSVYQVIPGDKNLPTMTRWKRSYYAQESIIGGNLPWKLVLEAPMAPMQKNLYTFYVQVLSTMAILAALAMLLASLLSRWIAQPLEKLAKVTTDLPGKLLGSVEITWPNSSAREIHSLIANFRSMSGVLEENFAKVSKNNAQLEKINQELHTEILERQKAHDHLESVLANSADAIGMVDRHGNFTRWNKAAEELYGYTFEELKGKPAFNLYADPEELNVMLEQLRRRGFVRKYEIMMKKKDGAIFPCNLSISLLQDTDCEVVGSITVARDRTETKQTMARLENEIIEHWQTEQALQESEQKLAHIINFLPDATLVIDVDGKVIAWNRAAEEMTGVKSQNILGKDNYEYALPFYGERRPILIDLVLKPHSALESTYEHLEREDSSIRAEAYAPALKGRRAYLIARASVLRDSNGNITGAIESIRDLTERREMEESLRLSEQRFRLLAETIQDAFWMATPGKDQLIYVSPAYEQIWGRPLAEMYQNPKSSLDAIHPEDRAAVLHQMVESNTHGSPCELQYRIIRPDCSVRWIHDRAFPIRDTQGNLTLMAGICTDITEQKELEGQLVQSQKMEAVGRLAGGVAHDFNNILTAIICQTELLSMKLPPEDPTCRDLAEIQEAAERAAALTRQLLAFSRKQIVQPKALNLNDLVANLDKMLRRLLGEDIELETVRGPELGLVMADPAQIQQVIMNLVVNARDAMPHGGRLTIETADVELDQEYARHHLEVQPGPYVMVAVSDNGPGIRSDVLPHIFEPFFTTKEVGQGSGLGLSMVHGIVKQSGGHTAIYSEPGEGTTFKIYLPRLTKSAQVIDEVESERTPVVGNETILLVEDEEPVRNVIRRGLEMNGYKVLDAGNGDQARLLSQQYAGPIQLLLTDVVMPGMSGREVADLLLATRNDMKVLYMSGHTENAIIHHRVLEQKVAFIEKPFRNNDLLHKIRHLLDAA